MRYNQYKFKFYLNANHSIYLNGVSGQNHPHTWELTLDTIKVINGFVQFNDVEKSIEAFLAKYQDRNLNEIEPFNSINPALENICNYFKDEFQKILYESGWILTSIEISETPARSYIIDLVDEMDLNSPKPLDIDLPDEIKSIDELAEDKLNSILSTIK